MAIPISSWKNGGTGRGAYNFVARSATQIPVTVRAAAGQTANVLVVENSAGTDLFTIDNSGNITVAGSISAVVNETVTGDLSLTGALTVTGASVMNGNVTLGNAQTDTLNVYALSTFHGPVTFSSSVSSTGQVLLANGTAGVPSLAFADDLDTGMYRVAANQIGWAVNGVVELTLNATNLSPGANDGSALGVSGTAWADLFLASGAVIDFNAGDVTLTHSSNILTIDGGDFLVANGFGVIIGHTAQVTTDGATELQVLGTGVEDSSMILGRWSADTSQPQLEFVKSRNAAIGSSTIVQDNDNLGAVHWHADDGTDFVNRAASFYAQVDDASPAANDIGTAFVWDSQPGGGGALREVMRIPAAGGLLPGTNDQGALGASGTAWSDLFLASGAVIDFNAGDVTLTHSANTLAFAGASSGYTFDAVINSNNATSSSITLQNQTFTAGAGHNAIAITPTWASENFNHTAVSITATQNSTNTQTLTGVNIAMAKATVATTLATLKGINIAAPSVTGTATTTYGIDIANQATGNSVTTFGIRIQTQSASSTITRAIELEGTGINNAIRFAGGGSLYSSNTGNVTLTQPVVASDTASPALRISGGAHTATTASQEVVDFDFDFDRTVQFATGAVTTQRSIVIDVPTYAFVGASTITSAVGVSLASMPTVGTNATITNAIGFSAGALGGHNSAATNAYWMNTEIPGIANGTGAVTSRVGFSITGPEGGSTNISLGNQTATLTQLVGFQLASLNVNSTTNTRTVTQLAGLLVNPFSAASNKVEFGAMATASFSPEATMYASAASSTFRVVEVSAETFTLGKTTQLTSTTPAIAGVFIDQITVAQSGGAVTVDNGASLYIAGALGTGGSVTVTNNYALWVDAGVSRFDGMARWGAGTAITAAQYEIGRDADGTNQLHLNVPTGATMEFSVNDAAVWTSGASVFTTAANTDINMSAGGRFYGGGVQFNKQDLGANTNLTLDENDSVVNVTTGAGTPNTITLPAASGNEGMIVSVYLVTDGGQNANVVRAGSDVIQVNAGDLSNTQVALDDAGDYVMLQCVNSTMWQVIANIGGTVT